MRDYILSGHAVHVSIVDRQLKSLGSNMVGKDNAAVISPSAGRLAGLSTMPTPVIRPLGTTVERAETRAYAAIIGGGLGGFAAAISLRRQGHRVTVYEKRDIAAEVGNSISCAKNGGQWLHEWGVDIDSGYPIDLQKLVMRDYKTGAVDMIYDMSAYEQKWGFPYYMFHRQDMLRMMITTATQTAGQGPPSTLKILHSARSIDFDRGEIEFENGLRVTADLIIGADGVVSKTRALMDLEPTIKLAASTCYRCNVRLDQLQEMGLERYADPAIQFWGGFETDDVNKYNKIVMAPCNGGKLISFYCFYPAKGFNVQDVSVEDLVSPFSQLDPDCLRMLNSSIDRKPWRLYEHTPLTGWTQGRTGLLGDACHAMFPHQSQGACQGIEDAAALGLIFSRRYNYTGNIEEGLKMYESIRKPRADRVALCSRLATEDIRERIGFSSLPGSVSRGAPKPIPGHKRLTIEEINGYDMVAHLDELVPSHRKH
ncbi:hypothetical protein FFLO_06720 [Filobasidium floriforme]|uniref:FAD-binding domain-containing protein n=1 Tax=Filobasidium floriforme TaxID=5210 RepID=A0A8K0JFQ0_9TREE|nr:uncharacterized protein HD553DRAFT_330179 [Filobasidium floriforme]KAG7527658.1 hypothetical protein FFLO_06720 [Filobasidium floriforme]KAH8077449.1 hypothetical protein HD553DRAFT_330179 [Filobasidium floriforme]